VILDKHTAELAYRTCKTFVSHQARHGQVYGVSLRMDCVFGVIRYRPGSSLLVIGYDADERYDGIASFREAYGLEEAKDIW
jgi:hypothetical protein